MEEFTPRQNTELTPQELRVLKLRAQEKSIAEIAESLVIEEVTVKFHLSNIYDKLGLREIRSRSARLLRIQQYYQKLSHETDKSDSPAGRVPEIEQEPESEQVQEPFSSALLLVLDDEIALLEKSKTAIQPAILHIPPGNDQPFTRSRRFNARHFAVLILATAVVIGAFIGASVTTLLLRSTPQASTSPPMSNAPDEQLSITPIDTQLRTTESATVDTAQTTTEPTTTISLCGETHAIQYAVSPTFLRHQGVSIFTTENATGAVVSNFVRNVALDERGLWIGYGATDQNPISGIGLSTRQQWFTCRLATEVPNQAINAIELDAGRRIWVATERSGIWMFDGTQWHTYTTDHGLPSNAIFGLAIDDKGAIWAATLAGVATLDGDTWKVPYSASNSRLVTNKTHALAFDSQGNIWVGHIEAGVSQYDNATATWRYYSAEPDGLGGDQIRDIVVRKANADTPESVWFATADGGLSKFEDGKWITYRTQDGLPSNTMIGVALDKYNRLWAATAGGVAYLEGTKWITYNTLNTLAIAFGPTCRDCPIDDDHVWTGTAEMGLTHSRLPHLNNDAAVKIEAICFELIVERKQECVPLEESEVDNTKIMSATYQTPIAPGEKIRFKITAVPRAPHQLRQDRGDFLSNIDADDSNLFSAWPSIPVEGTIEPGEPFTFAEYDYPIVAPQLMRGGEQTFISSWRVWMRTRYVGPIIRLTFTVRDLEE